VTGQLAQLDELQNQQLVHPDAFSVEDSAGSGNWASTDSGCWPG
jgi:hypothetical protein